MKLKFVALLALIAGLSLAAPAAVTVTVNLPTATNVVSPVKFEATANSSNAITGWWVYLDGKNMVHGGAVSIFKAHLTVPAGTHTMVIRAWDTTGAFGDQTLVWTVSSGSSPTITVTPATVALQVGLTQQFTATLTNTTNKATWSVNGVAGGNSSVGTVSAAGLYTAPATLPSNPAVTITAADAADNISATAGVTLSGNPTPVTVAINPATSSLQTSKTQQFAATVTGTTNTAVNWYAGGVQGGNSTVGTISTGGLYTAPATAPASAVTVMAQSVYSSSATANASVTVTQSSGGGNNYYISTTGNDSNDGSAAHPWATFAHADSAIQPGATVHVLPGTYTAQVTTNTNGTASARIKWVSDTKWGAKINVNSSGSYNVWQNYGNYVTIEGFDMTGPGCLGLVNWASFTQIVGNHVHNITAPAATCTDNGGAGIDDANYSASDDDIIGNVVHDVGDYTNPNSDVHGIYHSNLRGHIYNNISYRNQGWGIHLWHAAQSVTVANNTVFNNGYGGLLIGDPTGGPTVDDNTVVANNIVVWNGNWGIEEYGDTGTHNQYLNNLVYGNASGPWLLQNGNHDSGTVLEDPQFVNYTSDGTGDYHLQSSSPAINNGTATGVPAYDFDGGPRPIGSGYDIGCYEYGTTDPAWPWM